jgi:NAD(P)-dependent dehydrogenase (short-subunit alcohol dehydrogenase family)
MTADASWADLHGVKAVVTGAGRGLGRGIALALGEMGASVGALDLDEASAEETFGMLVDRKGTGCALRIDVTDPVDVPRVLEACADRLGGLDLLVNNAGILGPSPQPALADYPLDVLSEVYLVNVIAPLGLIQEALPLLAARSRGTIVNITSDAAVEPYEGWGGYGSAKAALEQLTAILAAERGDVRVLTADPGDMRTRMHQEAFPGEDISDRPPPEASVPGLLALIDGEHPSGRYRVSEVAV